MLAHDPAKVAFAKDAKFTENGQRLSLPDGLWNTMTAKGKYRLFVPDVEAQSVGFFGSIQVMGAGAMLGVRLKVRNNQIEEAEQSAYPAQPPVQRRALSESVTRGSTPFLPPSVSHVTN